VLLKLRILRLTLGSLVAAPCVFAQATPRVRLIEELRLDGAKEDFASFGPVAIGPQGKIALAMRQDFQVWIYDAAGKQLAKVGRRGGGPGEFSDGIGNIGWMADTLWVGDIGRRVSFFTGDGKLVRTVSMPASMEPQLDRSTPRGQPMRYLGQFSSMFVLSAILPDGSYLGNASLAQTDLPPGQARRAYLVLPPSGEPRTVATFTESTNMNPLFFRPFAFFAPDGSALARISVDTMSMTGTFTVARFRLNGDTVFRSRIRYTGVRLTQGAIDSALATMISRPGSEGSEPAIRKTEEAQQAEARKNIPPVYNPLWGMHLGYDGTTLVSLRPVADSLTVLLLNARGTVVNSIVLSHGARISAGSATHVWIREIDADGLPSLVRYRLAVPICRPPECR
jgi:hypothetical protein